MESQLDCLKSLFGDVDSGKIYEICQGSCLCDALSLEDPMCTDPSIFHKFCPSEYFSTTTSANEKLSDSTAAVFLQKNPLTYFLAFHHLSIICDL